MYTEHGIPTKMPTPLETPAAYGVFGARYGLEALEARSRKGRVKWCRAQYAFRQGSITRLMELPHLTASIFVTTFRNARHYFA